MNLYLEVRKGNGAIALSYTPPPFCYWWLSWKNATESFSYGNPNPRGVRKCNSTNKILYFLWKMCGKWIYTSHIAEEKFYSFFAFICRLKPNKRNVQLCYLSFIWHFRTKRRCSVSVAVNNIVWKESKSKYTETSWNVFSAFEEKHTTETLLLQRNYCSYIVYTQYNKILSLDPFSVHCDKMFSADLCALLLTSQVNMSRF